MVAPVVVRSAAERVTAGTVGAWLVMSAVIIARSVGIPAASMWMVAYSSFPSTSVLLLWSSEAFAAYSFPSGSFKWVLVTSKATGSACPDFYELLSWRTGPFPLVSVVDSTGSSSIVFV